MSHPTQKRKGKPSEYNSNRVLSQQFWRKQNPSRPKEGLWIFCYKFRKNDTGWNNYLNGIYWFKKSVKQAGAELFQA